MGSPDLFRALTRSLRGGSGRSVTPDELQLTPYLSIVVAILYMMAADGDISDRESSQLQSVVGADDDSLRRAVAYAESHSVDQFLQEVPAVLDAKARLCLLMNVCDSLMADGQLATDELLLFDRLLAALGHSKATFHGYFDAIAIKDRTSVLGDFDAAATAQGLTPPMVLVVSLLYMMSADGSMAEEEIGRLNAVVGNSQALVKASLRYVSQVRAPQFLASAAQVLDEQQRLCVLLNACDAMMADRQVAGGERDLFRRMLAAFGIAAGEFDRYLNVIFLKNDFPLDERQGRTRPRSDGIVFERKRQWEEETGEAGTASPVARRRPRAADAAAARDASMGSRISQTMQDNIDRMSDDLDDGIEIGALEKNSRGGAQAAGAATGADGPTDLRAFREAEISEQKANVTEAGRQQGGRHWKDADGDADRRAMQDASAAAKSGSGKGHAAGAAGKHWKDAQGGSDARAWQDADGDGDVRASQDAGGGSDVRAWQDADRADGRSTPAGHAAGVGLGALKDAEAAAARAAWRDDAPSAPGKAWRDATTPGDRRALEDADALPTSSAIVDDRRSFDHEGKEDSGTVQGPHPITGRMGTVSERTKTIDTHLEAMRAAPSITAANRLPHLPKGPAVQRRLPAAAVIVDQQRAIGVIDLPSAMNEHAASMAMDEQSGYLLASDEGGPILSENTTPANPEQARQHRKLRQWSGALLPALFLTYGTTMVGETAAERTFITNENMATDARVVHQMASVQQTVYRVAPDAVTLAAPAVLPRAALAVGSGASGGVAGAASGAAAGGVAGAGGISGAAAAAGGVTSAGGIATVAATYAPGAAAVAEGQLPSDREQADQFLEQRKQELRAAFEQHQGASAVASQRQQWFVYAKSIVLLGLGMAFWGVLFRSMRMLHVSTAAGIAGLLLTANGYWLFVQI